jgi:hypothetical protein
MSERKVELLRRFVEAYNARDTEAFIAGCDPSVEAHTAFAAVGGVYHGHGGMRSWQQDVEDIWGEEIRIEPEAYFDLGRDTLLFFVLSGRGRSSGVEVAMPIATVFRWRDGLIICFKGYANRADALRDLGVSEDDLEPIEP